MLGSEEWILHTHQFIKYTVLSFMNLIHETNSVNISVHLNFRDELTVSRSVALRKYCQMLPYKVASLAPPPSQAPLPWLTGSYVTILFHHPHTYLFWICTYFIYHLHQHRNIDKGVGTNFQVCLVCLHIFICAMKEEEEEPVTVSTIGLQSKHLRDL